MLECPLVEIYPQLIREAELAVAEKYANGMTKALVTGGDVTGFLAELIVYDWLKMLNVPASWENANGYDLVLANGMTIDIKAMRYRGIPKPFYTAEILTHCLEYQKPDYFLWVGLEDDGPNTLPRRAHILGGLTYLEFLSRAHTQKAGNISPKGFIYKTDRQAVHLSQLIPGEALVAQWRKEICV